MARGPHRELHACNRRYWTVVEQAGRNGLFVTQALRAIGRNGRPEMFT